MMELKTTWRHNESNLFDAAGLSADRLKESLLSGSRAEKERALAIVFAAMVSNEDGGILGEAIALLAKPSENGVLTSQIAELLEKMIEEAPDYGLEEVSKAVANMIGGST